MKKIHKNHTEKYIRLAQYFNNDADGILDFGMAEQFRGHKYFGGYHDIPDTGEGRHFSVITGSYYKIGKSEIKKNY